VDLTAHQKLKVEKISDGMVVFLSFLRSLSSFLRPFLPSLLSLSVEVRPQKSSHRVWEETQLKSNMVH